METYSWVHIPENMVATYSEHQKGCSYNSELWESTNNDDSPERKLARLQKRKLNYISNILVIDDPKHPEYNGRVMVFKYGKKIFEKIVSAAKPIFDDETPVNVFDYWTGANFKLRMKQVDGYPNYDSSVFMSSKVIADSDEEILRIADAQYLLKEFLNPKEFKSYEENKKRLDYVLNTKAMPTANTIAEAATREAVSPKSISAPMEDNDDDLMGYFKSIAFDEEGD